MMKEVFDHSFEGIDVCFWKGMGPRWAKGSLLDANSLA
jgi:hypothetical protein